MEKITIDEFIAEIETIFQNYADTNDIDRVSIKTWVIDRLRKFGKNICDQRDIVVGINNSRALLPETFKSLVLALKIDDQILKADNKKIREIPYKKYIIRDVVWDSPSQEYIQNNCQSQLVIEKLLIDKEPIEMYTDLVPLSLVKGIQKDSLDVDCYNLHPMIRNNYPQNISITNRTLNTNFRSGLVYLQYNSLPSDEDGEIVVPILSTGDIKDYITNHVKIQIAENLIANDKNPKGLQNLVSLWLQQDRQLFIQAKSEANYAGLDKNWAKKMYQNKIETINRFNLPK